MQITGTFKDISNTKTYTVTISKTGDAQSIYNIKNVTDPDFNDTTPTILFSMDPVHITTDYSDTFAHNIVKSASVNLITNFNLRDLILASNNNDVSLVIACDGVQIFNGYVEPLCFSEPYARFWNEIEITANDKLASAQYIKYPQIVLDRQNEMMVFLDAGSDVEGEERGLGIINEIAAALGLTIDTEGFNSEILQALRSTKISNMIFAGDSPDDWMTCFDVLESVGRYWGIWFMQVGNTLRLLDWHNETRESISTTKKDFIDDSTNISTADAYTQIKLSCDIDDADSIVEFGDDIVSPYPHYVKYLEELVAEGNGSRAAERFKTLLVDDITAESDPLQSYKYKNFCWVKESKLWDFGPNGYTEEIKAGATQQEILDWLREHPGKGAFVSFGRTDKMDVKDNSPINSIELQDGLIISVCGHDDETYESTLQNFFNYNGPICSFTGSSKQFTPTDSNTTNYLIINGKILLNKMYAKTGESMAYNYKRSCQSGLDYDQINGTLYTDYCNTYEDLLDIIDNPGVVFTWMSKYDQVMYHNAVPRIGSNEYGCFYTHKFFNGTAGSETYDSSIKCLVGDLKQTKYQQTWKYEYSMIEGKGKAIDNTSKIPILLCELKIGNKYCVERIDLGPEGWGRFDWIAEEDAAEIIIDGQPWHYLTIGINPKLDDYIIGTNYDIQNTIWYYDDVDGTGTAIPIKFSDNLAGEVKFTIKQPFFQYWEQSSSAKGIFAYMLARIGMTGNFPILEKLESIILSDFKIELTSDKGHIMNNTENNDLVYASDENDDYVESHEDETKIATMITSAEAAEWGTEMIVSDSHVANIDNSPFYGFAYDSGEVDTEENIIYNYIKPEQLYVNNYYLEYSEARQIVETGIKIKDIEWLQTPDKYKFGFGFLEGEYVPIGYDANLLKNSVAFTMKDMSTKNTDDDNGE